MTSLLQRCRHTARRERRASRSSWRLVLCFAALCAFVNAGKAQPYIPRNDAVVLDRVPAGSQLRQFQPLRRALAANPDDVNAALQLSRAYLDIGRSTSDPRFISYAQATLAPWVQRPDASAEALILGAITLQSSHRFDEALMLLERAMRSDPRNSQAWLTRATILQVQGEFGAARRACAQLIGVADQVIALTCIASVNAMNGKLPASHAALEQVLGNSVSLSRDIRGWLLGQLGEMSVRLGNDDVAERHFKAALQANADDLYVKAEYADLLLRQHRATETIALLKDNEAQDALLLRLAIAGVELDTSRGRRWSEMYAARREAARRDGDATHLREQARFVLEVQGNAAAALKLAEQNWQVQREPADIRIYVRSAGAVRDPAAVARIATWISENSYQDRTLAPARNPARENLQ